MPAKSHFINGHWEAAGGSEFQSRNPATGEVVWHRGAGTAADVNRAVAAARQAFAAWGETPVPVRIAALHAFAEHLQARRAELAEAISLEVGKPRWEAATEVEAMINKVPVSIEAYHQRRAAQAQTNSGTTTATRFKPHGVVAVFGPFNFPGHLPNGHIVPALLAGNTVVFKPSEMTPLVAERTLHCWEAAKLPNGVINLVQGGRETGVALSAHPDLDGLFFTGSAAVGIALRRALAETPEKILALEMGGNNPLIVHEASDIRAAAYLAVQSAFLTAGQRCTCARRLIVPVGHAGDAFVEQLAAMTRNVCVGAFTEDPEPFMGPVISPQAAEKLLMTQTALVAAGGESIVEMQQTGQSAAMLRPGIIDVTRVLNRPDAEVFGPLLQVIRVADFDAAIQEANATAYGLAAGLISDRADLYQRFYHRIRAGVVNFNRATTGASGSLPFGGVGMSGNHRPSGFYAADYCSYPVASMESDRASLPAKPSPGITL